ncbi:2-keto-3-deoxy-L-rhamnonate aldolase [Aliishimia ponticola]|uniref:Hydroxypyruvate/pyruvate aldolase n=1 Tax=Aliishimia ponticola TaxID=2499833 RepID=A0A4S4NEP8_9RHOB|nr:HpcH/HpaI aldolase/citrate lyase family protein [Aliishimia ponticola]THH36598.1 2-keto-3-deoxy-L-rhamnonate aldolase [Aliishimia ponticola]
MPAPINPFKAALKEGRVVYGCWMGLAAHNAAEIVGTAGFDWLVIDNEHSPNDLRSTRDSLMALKGSDSHAVVRVPVGEPWIIKQMLDAGAQTIIVPMVESAEQAEMLVKAMRYPPHGIRGVGYSMTRSSMFSQIADYGTTADDQVCLIVQVENRAGLAALDDILAVDGIDGVFIGPADLGADLGFMGDLMNPQVVSVIIDAIARIAASDKAAGILTTNEEMIEKARDAGAQFIAVGLDVLILAGAVRELAAKYKA